MTMTKYVFVHELETARQKISALEKYTKELSATLETRYPVIITTAEERRTRRALNKIRLIAQGIESALGDDETAKKWVKGLRVSTNTIEDRINREESELRKVDGKWTRTQIFKSEEEEKGKTK